MNALDRTLGSAAAELESEMAGEHMDIPHGVDQVRDFWKSLPPDLKREIGQRGRLMWDLRQIYFARFMATVNALFAGNPAHWQQALEDNRAQATTQLAAQAGRAAGLAPRPSAQRPGFSDPQVRTYHNRQFYRGFIPGRNRQTGRYREMEAELELASRELENGEGFWTKVTPIPGLGNKEGHEIIARAAMSGFPLSAAEQSALLDGIIRPDRGGRSYWNFPGAALGSFRAANQAAHSLRATESTTTPVALATIQQRFRDLYSRALASSGRATALGWLGEAMHLLQDSFSSAHVERAGATGPIRHIRAFYLKFGWPPHSTAPNEHNVPSDDRDNVFAGGALRPEAVAAVNASRDLLAMFLRHFAAPGSPVVGSELNAFIAGNLSM